MNYHLKALNILKKSLPSNYIEIGQSLMEVALIYHYLGLNIQSISILSRAKEIFQLSKNFKR